MIRPIKLRPITAQDVERASQWTIRPIKPDRPITAQDVKCASQWAGRLITTIEQAHRRAASSKLVFGPCSRNTKPTTS